MNNTDEDMKMEIEAIKKAQTGGILERRNTEMQTGNTEASFTIRIQEMEDRISDIKDRI